MSKALSQDLLQEYLEFSSGPDAAASEDLLAELIIDYAVPVMRAEVERRLSGAARETIEDVLGTATAWLIERLRRLPGSESQIRDFEAYAAGLAAKATAQYIADQSPQRARLRRKLRLLCASDDRFFLEESGGRWLCGLREHQGRDAATAASVEQCRAHLAAVLLPVEFPACAKLFFRELGAPGELNQTVAAFASLLGISGRPQSFETLTHEPAVPPAVDSTGPAEWVERLWHEIRLLPRDQRVALLLNLRLPGGAAIELFEEIGIADVGLLAETLEIPREELAALWGRLPLGDLEIGARLGVARQKVINLRAAARERLRRRTTIGTNPPARKDRAEE